MISGLLRTFHSQFGFLRPNYLAIFAMLEMCYSHYVSIVDSDCTTNTHTHIKMIIVKLTKYWYKCMINTLLCLANLTGKPDNELGKIWWNNKNPKISLGTFIA